MDNPSKKILRRFSKSVHMGAIKNLQLMAYSFVSQEKQINTWQRTRSWFQDTILLVTKQNLARDSWSQ